MSVMSRSNPTASRLPASPVQVGGPFERQGNRVKPSDQVTHGSLRDNGRFPRRWADDDAAARWLRRWALPWSRLALALLGHSAALPTARPRTPRRRRRRAGPLPRHPGGPGVTGTPGPETGSAARARLRAAQDATLASVGAGEPVYRWTEALNGYAVELTSDQADALAADPAVALVEPNAGPTTGRESRLRRGGPATRPRLVLGALPRRRGRGRRRRRHRPVAGEPALRRRRPASGRRRAASAAAARRAPTGRRQTCNRKVVGARWFVDGFGTDNVRSSTYLSPRDDNGHGTQVASIAVGNADVSVRGSGEALGTFAGVAPQARIAVYKACWTAPDPADDGCATADLVTAVDRAVEDGVDVLNLSVAGPAGLDTLERALLGAAEADVVVVAAAGNSGRSAYAAHASPWVTTVGGTTTALPSGRVQVAGGPTLEGAMVSRRAVPRSRIVLGARVAAPGAAADDATLCRPGSLDAGQVAGAIVVCDRGGIGRLDKSAAVAQAGGVAMVLTNVSGSGLALDLHVVPTVHLDRRRGRPPHRPPGHGIRGPGRRCARRAPSRGPVRVVRWSGGGDPASALVKPDLVAPATGRLGSRAAAPRRQPVRLPLRHVGGVGAGERCRGAAARRARRLVGGRDPLGPDDERAPDGRRGAAPGRRAQHDRRGTALAAGPRRAGRRLPALARRRSPAGGPQQLPRSCSTATAR